MSESSAKAMRGGEMDDVIFGGTGERPARNIAEVSLRLDNTDRRAPSAFNDSDELEVDFELEADLGIDTVKQAEILSELTEHYGLERDEDFRIADYPTIEALAGYLATAVGAPTITA